MGKPKCLKVWSPAGKINSMLDYRILFDTDCFNRHSEQKCGSSCKLVFCLFVISCYILFCLFFTDYCLLEECQAIHARPYQSCYPTCFARFVLFWALKIPWLSMTFSTSFLSFTWPTFSSCFQKYCQNNLRRVYFKVLFHIMIP